MFPFERGGWQARIQSAVHNRKKFTLAIDLKVCSNVYFYGIADNPYTLFKLDGFVLSFKMAYLIR